MSPLRVLQSLSPRPNLDTLAQDITADSWILNKLPKHLKWAGPIQSSGTKVGLLLGFSIFSILEEVFTWVTLKSWILTIIVCLLVTNFIILAFVEEGHSEQNQVPATFSTVKLIAKKMVKLVYIRKLAPMFVTIQLCAATIFHGKLFYIQLQDKGFTRSEIGKIELYLAPL